MRPLPERAKETMDPTLSLIGRSEPLFDADLLHHDAELAETVRSASFLVIGGGGTIGQAVCREIFRRSPGKLHVVDISENGLVELVRDLRSSFGYIPGEFRTFVVDAGSSIFETLVQAEGPYDYILNLSAIKHVRSERDPYTLMRMVEVNILNTERTVRLAIRGGAKKYFAVSTDKAADPVNMMGASKRIMELFLSHHSQEIPISTARFANVAFSDGSLLHGFRMRLMKRQPLAAPSDIRRYFITQRESGELCLLSSLLGKNREILIPKLDGRLRLISLEDVARRFLASQGYKAHPCESEEEARKSTEKLIPKGLWPCYFSPSDTTGEKPFEEFRGADDEVLENRFQTVDVLRLPTWENAEKLRRFLERIEHIRQQEQWEKREIRALFQDLLPGFRHEETGHSLDEKM